VPVLSDCDEICQIVELGSPEAELLFHFRFERYGDEQATPLGLIMEMLNIHSGPPLHCSTFTAHNGHKAFSFSSTRLPLIHFETSIWV
jgi:hypothetical protein